LIPLPLRSCHVCPNKPCAFSSTNLFQFLARTVTARRLTKPSEFSNSISNKPTFKKNSAEPAIFSYLSSHEIFLKVGLFEIELENSDGFVNLRAVTVRAKNWNKLVDEKAHGLLGQTWQLRKGKGINAVIEGKVDDYLILDDEVFGETFMYNKFHLLNDE